MDNATCNLIYVDRNVLRDGVVHNTDAVNGFVPDPECEILKKNLSILRDAFNDSKLPSTPVCSADFL